jgi:hypothetical protein
MAMAASDARADAGVHDHGHLHRLPDELDVDAVLDAEAAPDRRAEGHHRRRPRVLQLLRDHHVVGGVREDDEALLDERAGGGEQALGVGVQRLLVPDHLQLDPVAEAGLAPEAGGPHRLVGRVARGGVGQDEEPLRVDVVEEVLGAAGLQVHAADGHRHHLGPGRLVSVLHDLEARVLAGADDEARSELTSGEDEGVGAHVLDGSTQGRGAMHGTVPRVEHGCGGPAEHAFSGESRPSNPGDGQDVRPLRSSRSAVGRAPRWRLITNAMRIENGQA